MAVDDRAIVVGISHYPALGDLAGPENDASAFAEWLKSSTDLYRYAVRMIAGESARAAVDERILGVHHYYHGPYPLVWSGLMKKGVLNPNAVFLLLVGRRTDWIEALEGMTFE